jgi:hypothetical protein
MAGWICHSHAIVILWKLEPFCSPGDYFSPFSGRPFIGIGGTQGRVEMVLF